MIKPVLHRILVQLEDIDEVTESGIIIAKELIKKERKAVEKGTVLAIGDTAFKDYGGSHDTVKVGDKVLIRIVDTDKVAPVLTMKDCDRYEIKQWYERLKVELQEKGLI